MFISPLKTPPGIVKFRKGWGKHVAKPRRELREAAGEIEFGVEGWKTSGCFLLTLQLESITRPCPCSNHIFNYYLK